MRSAALPRPQGVPRRSSPLRVRRPAPPARGLVRRGALRDGAHLRRPRRVRSLPHRGQLGRGLSRGGIRLAPAPRRQGSLRLRRPGAPRECALLRRVPPGKSGRAAPEALRPAIRCATMNRLATLLLLFAAPAFAQSTSELEGVYLAAGGGGGLLIAGDHSFAYDVEARLGYSFSPGTQIYLTGALDGGTLPSQFFGGVSVGFGGPMPDLAADTNGVGLAFAGGLGLEIRLAKDFFLAPEFYYRNATLTATASSGVAVQVIGLQLSAIYY